MGSSASQALGQATAEPLHDNLRAAHFLFPDDKKPHDMPDIFEAGAEVESGVAQSSKKLFWTSGDTLVLNQRAAVLDLSHACVCVSSKAPVHGCVDRPDERVGQVS